LHDVHVGGQGDVEAVLIAADEEICLHW
jgi:hypothetical protein